MNLWQVTLELGGGVDPQILGRAYRLILGVDHRGALYRRDEFGGFHRLVVYLRTRP